MRKLNKYIISLILSTSAGSAYAYYPGPYFIMDFENGLQPAISAPTPAWTITPVFEQNYGSGNFFEVTETTSHSGNFSLRFTYEARHDFCNTCGLKKFTHKSGLDNVSYFVADPVLNDITDLTTQEDDATSKANDGPGAKPGRIVYNKDNGYSRWQIVSIKNDTLTNDKLLLRLLDAGIGGETPEFNSGNDVSIARQCGVDGHIGGEIERRSDCDNVITWFGITKADEVTQEPVFPQGPGTSIFRRIYLKPEVTSTGMHQKLLFFRVGDNGPDAANIVMYADNRRGTEIIPEISGFRDNGGAAIYKPGDGNGLPADILFERSAWHYVEQEFTASTLNPNFDPNLDPELNPDDPNIQRYNPDGTYKLWFSKSGEEDTAGATPTLVIPNLRLAPLTSASLWGNVQHDLHLRGSWYIDDVYIDSKKIGKASTASINNTAPPLLPTVTTK